MNFFNAKQKKHRYANHASQIGFIVGTGRCGTTILSQVLNSHSKICVPPELQIIVSAGNGERLFDKYTSGELKKFSSKHFIDLVKQCCPYHLELFFDYQKHFKELKYPQTDLAEILNNFFDHICYTHNKEIFLEQTPWNGQNLGILKKLFPKMKVIHLIRDGRDVALSFLKTPWWYKDIEKNILRWEKEINCIHQFGTNNLDNFFEIRYEDLILNPEIELSKILTLLDLRFEKDMINPEKLINYSEMFKGNFLNNQSNNFKNWTKNKKETFFKDSIYAWRKEVPSKFSDLPKSVSDTLKRFNYEI